jgi:hypothetical protein
MTGRDYQRSAVYRWENEHIGRKDRHTVDINTARGIVKHVWQAEGLDYPPFVEEFGRNVRSKNGDSNRFRIRLQKRVPTWVVLHEVAHSLNSTIDDVGDRHGPNYLGIYMWLLTKYGGFDLPLLMYTATQAGLEFNLNARFVLLDTLQT